MSVYALTPHRKLNPATSQQRHIHLDVTKQIFTAQLHTKNGGSLLVPQLFFAVVEVEYITALSPCMVLERFSNGSLAQFSLFGKIIQKTTLK